MMMARDIGNAGSAGMRQPRLALDALPPEILALILECLVPQSPEIGETRPVAYNQLMVDEPCVCRVSRHLYQLARPLLYRVIAMCDETTMFLLFRTLCEKPEYGHATRYLSCHMTLTHEDDTFTMPSGTDAITLPHMLLNEGDLDHLPQTFLCFILTFLPKLETHLLQVPICDDQEEYNLLCIQIDTLRHNIHTLLLQGDPELLGHFEHEDCDCDVPESLFANFPNLTTLEISSDDGIWSGNPLPAGACPRDLHQLLLNAPHLETLYMAPRPDGLDRAIELDPDSDHADPEALDIALATHGKQLRNLDPLIGPDGRLTALAQMTSLQKLCIQMATLYGSPAAVAQMPLVELLPPNLVELALEDWWWPNAELLDFLPEWSAADKVGHYQSQHLYRVSALETLNRFARDVRTRLGALKKVVLLCKIPWTWVMEGGIEIDFHFEGVKREFAAQGVQFEVRCDEVLEEEERDGGGHHMPIGG
ncbi:hypothetical protein BT67DRAFT_459813 [Trichocladium antarcticum]|uniref:F-box domain-containing protein n=1 Tax=Trichocladium antarcticum TaxID=1450529 RepID=A0AAN6UQ26_9PEZI|nr:hypothetical protein BT67DRAFT_459813 [Trichocladium antarcticum]